MLPAERHQFIMDELHRNNVVTVNELAQQLNVTTMTIRRDLQLLEKNGLIEKSHGGAVLPETSVKEATYRNRKLIHVEEKQRIAKRALTFIESSMSIFLDAGTTSYELAELIAKKHCNDLTIVTNDMAIAQILSGTAGVDVIMLGGHIDAESNSTCGILALHMVEQMHFDICFLGTQAITPEWNIMTANAEKIDLKRACVTAADMSILLADHSKFKKYKLYYILDIWQMDVLISDYSVTADEIKLFQEHQLEYIQI